MTAALAASLGLWALAPANAPAQEWERSPRSLRARSAAKPASSASSENLSEALLLAHGVDPSSEASVARFLSEGIPRSKRIAGLPAVPKQRLSLFPMAMQLAAEKNYQAARAPLMRLLQGDYSAGVQLMVAEDSAVIGGGGREAFLAKVDQVLQFGAANALSVLNEPAALPWIRRRWEAEESPSGKVSYALLGCALGDRHYLDFLAEQAASDDPAPSREAFQALEQISGELYGVEIYTPIAVRREAAERARSWVASRGPGWSPRHADVLERRLNPRPSPKRLPDAPSSIRDHLLFAERVSLDNSEATRLGRESRRFLSELPPARAGDALVPIARNPREDVDVRLQAILWLGRSLGDSAKPIMRELAKDENPPVREQARAFLEKDS